MSSNKLPLLAALQKKCPYCKLRHSVCHATSHHYPFHKFCVINSLVRTTLSLNQSYRLGNDLRLDRSILILTWRFCLSSYESIHSCMSFCFNQGVFIICYTHYRSYVYNSLKIWYKHGILTANKDITSFSICERSFTFIFCRGLKYLILLNYLHLHETKRPISICWTDY